MERQHRLYGSGSLEAGELRDGPERRLLKIRTADGGTVRKDMIVSSVSEPLASAGFFNSPGLEDNPEDLEVLEDGLVSEDDDDEVGRGKGPLGEPKSIDERMQQRNEVTWREQDLQDTVPVPLDDTDYDASFPLSNLPNFDEVSFSNTEFTGGTTSTMPIWRANVYHLLHSRKGYSNLSRIGRFLNWFFLFALTVSIVAICVASETPVVSQRPNRQVLFAIESACVVVFVVEFTLHCIAAPTFRFMLKWMYLIDLLAIVPYFVEVFYYLAMGLNVIDGVYDVNALSAVRVLRVFRLLRMLKIFSKSSKVCSGYLVTHYEIH
ncbi:hypothetical protein HK102_010730 [Quaeritorhiza haematococci]|nr:hypothetical protein HK102_010730 [Quaeritorhiza haematococci]